MNNDETNKSPIDELVTYAEDAEDTDDNTPDIPPIDGDDFDDVPSEPTEDEDDYAGNDDGSDEYDDDEDYGEPSDEYEDNEPPYYDDDDYNDDDNVSDDGGKKKIKKIIIIAVILALITGIAAVLSIDTGIIATYKKNFANNFSKIFGVFTMKTVDNGIADDNGQNENYNTNVRGSVIVSDGVRGAEVVRYGNGIVCASSNHLVYIDSSGNTVWSEDTLIANPLIAANGSYILIAERGGGKLCLYNGSNMLYEADDPDNIAAISVSSSGDSVLVTSKAAYKGGISVYNKLGEQIYSWASGGGTVISADISPTSRNIAVSLLNTEASAKSIIQFFDINETQSRAQVNAEDTVMYDLRFVGNTLTAFGDNRLAVLSADGGVVADNDLTSCQLTHSAMDDSGNTVLTLYDGAVPKLNLYNGSGKERSSVTMDGMADFVDIHENTVLYSIGRDVFIGRPGIGSLTKYTAAMDIKKLILISPSTFAIVYSNSIEFVKV